MIASIRGEVRATGLGWIVLEVGGIGFRVETPEHRTDARVGAPLQLHTQLIVREDSLTLYGFATPEELQVFGILLGVSGVGPRSALGVLAELTPTQVAQAAEREDERPFRRVSGIGPKTAKLIAVQLAGKLKLLAAIADTQSHRQPQQATGDVEGIDQCEPLTTGYQSAWIVEQGLIGLGYSESEAARAVAEARAAGTSEEHAVLLRAALGLLQTPKRAGLADPGIAEEKR